MVFNAIVSSKIICFVPAYQMISDCGPFITELIM